MSLKLESIFETDPKLADELLEQACLKNGFNYSQIRPTLTPENVQEIIIQHMFSLIENPREHSILAGSIAMWQIYRTCPLTIEGYLNVFESYLCPEVVEFMRKHQDRLQEEIQYHRDFELSYFANGTLISTYLSRVKYDQDPLEIPQFCWMRIAVGEFCSRKNCDNLAMVIRAYHQFSERKIVPASPTIFNQGFIRGESISCMLFTIDDDMEDILDVIKEVGMASKNNAGIGIDFSRLRHSSIGRHGKSKGIIPLLKIYDLLAYYIDQGGRRPGAITASIRVHHIDLPEFIRIVDKVSEDKTKVTQLNTSILLCDLFMKRCEEGGVWTLFCPKQTGNLNLLFGKAFEEEYVKYEEKAKIWKRYQKYRALKQLHQSSTTLPDVKTELFEELRKEFEDQPIPEEIDSREFKADDLMTDINTMRARTGMPYIVHGDNLNRKNNMDNVGPCLALNLCQEVTIPTKPGNKDGETGSCNLASLSLKAFVTDGQFDFKTFGESVEYAVVCLNQVIDAAKNVSDKARRSKDNNRPIGIGVSGFSDMLAMMNLPAVDTSRLPKLRGYDDEGEPIYETVDISKEAPDYSDEALRERVLNPEVEALNWKIWSCKYYHALKSSCEEAQKYGPYPNFWTSHAAKGELKYHLYQLEEKVTGRKYPLKLEPFEPSSWGEEGSWDELIADIQKYGLRNAFLLACMPTSNSSQIVDNCESFEFFMQNVFVRKVWSGEYPVLNHHMVSDLQKIGLWNEDTYNQMVTSDGSILSLSEKGLSHEHCIQLRFLKEKYLTMWEIPQKIMVQLSAQRQVAICQSQSFNLYLKNVDVNVLKMIDKYTQDLGMTTGSYYIRSRSSSNALRIRGSKEEQSAKIGLPENQDSEFVDILEMVESAQSKIQARAIEEREEIIQKTLMSASRPEEIKVCNLGKDCVSCN